MAETRLGRWRRTRRYLPGAVLLAPALVVMTLMFFVPMITSLIYSFGDYSGIGPFTWVGLDNYTEILVDPRFQQAWANTAVFAVITMTVGPLLGLVTALMLNNRIPGRTFFRAVFFVPVTASLVVVSTLWKPLLNERGLLNDVLQLIGLERHDWLSDPSTALVAVSAASIWQGFGFETVVFLAALQTIPADLMESARMDGAGPWQRFLAVTLPSLRPTLLFVFVVGMIGAFQAFDQVYVMTGGGPVGSTTTVVFYLVERFRSLDLGHASAAAYLLVAVLVVISAIQFRIARTR
ncbi:MAG: sugar ABC transporter permease [Microbacteriaceae bacterium]|nr:sugar ABC transporter permease [Microbacteriaceae bacterium]